MVKAAVNLYVAWDLTICYKVDEKEHNYPIQLFSHHPSNVYT